MEILQLILFGAGVTAALLGSLWLLVESFRESILWGLGCLFFSPIQLVFLIMHWGVAKRPFGLQLLGVGLLVLSAFVDGPHSYRSF